MKQQFLSFLILLLPMVASADDSGKCGEGVTWNYNESTQTLTISGNGMMTEYDYMINPAERAPWYNYNADIRQLIIEDGVTNIGKGAFYGCSQMTDMYCYAENVPELGDEVFQFWINNATLHVPTVSLEAYRNAEQWKDFGNIVALTDNDPKPTGIKGVNSEAITTERYYSIDGKRFTTPQHGLNIVKMSDGTVKKVVIK